MAGGGPVTASPKNKGSANEERDAVLADPGFVALKAHIIAGTGLAYYQDKDPILAERVARRMAAVQAAGCAGYLARLQEEGPDGGEFQALIEEITIGETFFFRFAEQFEVLRRLVVPDCLRRNRDRRILRVWSAGTAVGAEAYSLAIVLRREFAAQLAGWDVSIVGTDINRRFLAAAERGVFAEWTMRGMPASVRRDCFTREVDGWRIRREFRQWVRFGVFDLANGTLPAPGLGLARFDIVLCRNVMIYFDEPTRARLVEGLTDSLADGGWLLMGPAETGTLVNGRLQPEAGPGAVVYHKVPPQPQPLPQPLPPLQPLRPPQPLRLPPHARSQPAPPFPVPGGAAPGPARSLRAAAPTLGDVARLTGRGARSPALVACEAACRARPLEAIAHYTRALLEIDLATGDPAASLRRTVYLDRDFALAHYHLGLIDQRRGKPDTARRHFRNVMRSLRALEDAAAVAHGCGLTAGELRSLAGPWLSGGLPQ
jgi:chemotaxis protein methyltransferase CheR